MDSASIFTTKMHVARGRLSASEILWFHNSWPFIILGVCWLWPNRLRAIQPRTSVAEVVLCWSKQRATMFCKEQYSTWYVWFSMFCHSCWSWLPSYYPGISQRDINYYDYLNNPATYSKIVNTVVELWKTKIKPGWKAQADCTFFVLSQYPRVLTTTAYRCYLCGI